MTSSSNKIGEHLDAAKQQTRRQKLATEVAATVPSTDGIALPILESVGGDFSQATFKRHATLLGDSRMSNPAIASQRALIVQMFQRDYGNQYVRRLLKQVKRSEAVEGNGSLANSSLVQTTIDKRQDSPDQVDQDTVDRIEGQQGSGRPLDAGIRAEMESAFGQDFGDVRVHTGPKADALNREVQAKAFTMGSDVFFREGNYAPDSSGGREILAHELTHVVQQQNAPAAGSGPTRVSSPDDATEVEAVKVAESIVNQIDVARQAEEQEELSIARQAAVHRDHYEFEPEQITVDTYNLRSAGRRPYDVIQDHVAQVSTALNNMRTGELGAITQFLTHMSFRSATDAQPDVLGAVFKHVGKQLWEAAIGRLPTVAGVPGSQIIGVITAMTNELERAAASQSEYQLASFMSILRSSTLTVYQREITTLQTSARRDLERQFTEQEGTWDESSTIVTGDKATFLRELDQRGAAILNAVPEPIEYEQALLARWITDQQAGGGGFTENFWSIVANGRVRLRYETEERNGRYTYNFESAKLFTSTHSGQAADMFTRIMNQQNKKVYELGVPVLVELETEGMTPGGRSYYGYEIRSRNDYDGPNYGWPPADRAWNNMPWDPIDQVRRVTGG